MFVLSAAKRNGARNRNREINNGTGDQEGFRNNVILSLINDRGIGCFVSITITITRTSTMGWGDKKMFDHEKLDVYKISLEFVAWVFSRVEKLKGNQRFARDELIRASQSIPRNIAEGNGKRSRADRNRFFEIARGSALECSAVIDELVIMGSMNKTEMTDGKILLHRIVSMLTKMTESKTKTLTTKQY